MGPVARQSWLPLLEVVVMLCGFHALERVGVYRIPLFVLMTLLLLRRAGMGATAIGLTRARLRGRVVARALGLALLLAPLAWLVLRPLAERVTHSTLEVGFLRRAVASPQGLALMLGLSWVFAGFGEEWCFRGYPLARLAPLGSGASWAGLAASAVSFGIAHNSQGRAGMLLTGMVAFLLGAVYLRSGRNLWLVILTHGLLDTIAMLLFHFRII